jgi:hypothetical protein
MTSNDCWDCTVPHASEIQALKERIRLTQASVIVITILLCLSWLTAFTNSGQNPPGEEVRATGILFVDSTGKGRVRIGADLRKRGLAGLIFYNEDGTEAGVLAYRGRRDSAGTIDARSLLTMDQFKSDQVIALDASQSAAGKRNGLSIIDQPDSLSRAGAALLDSLRVAINSSRSNADAQVLRREYLARLPAGDRTATRLFAGRDAERSSVITLSDIEGKPRLRFKVDAQGNASIEFLDASGRSVRTIHP